MFTCNAAQMLKLVMIIASAGTEAHAQWRAGAVDVHQIECQLSR